MSKDIPINQHALPVAYHTYALLLSSLDAEWTRGVAPPLDAFEHAKDSFETACESYRHFVEVRHQPLWAEGRKSQGLCNGGEIGRELFKPITWLPCGHADLLTAVLIDDLDAAQTIVELYPKTVEELTLAFCPIVESASNIIKPPTWFVESNCASDIESDQPLLAIIRLKLEGLLTVGRSLRLQNAVFNLVARTIERIESDPDLVTDGETVTRENISRLRIALLDLQDEEEIGLLIACDNFSAAMAINVCLQNLTVKDLIATDAATAHEWECCINDLGISDDHLRFIVEPTADPGASILDLISGTHLFRWTRTALAYSYALFREQHDRPTGAALGKIQGAISVMVDLNIPPGHRTAAETILEQATRSSSNPPAIPSACSFQMIGTADLSINPVSTTRQQGVVQCSGQLVHATDLLKTFVSLLTTIRDLLKSPSANVGRHISGWASALQIPVPHKIHKDLHNHRSVIGRLLAHMSGRLFPERNVAVATAAHTEKNKYQFSIVALRDATRNCGFPVALRRSLLFLYENFGTILANPRLFEVVLDYADFFIALNNMLTRFLPNELGVKESTASSHDPDVQRRRIDWHQVDHLGKVLDALTSSLELRLRRVYPDEDTRDWSIDFRSTLSQVLAAGEASLKSAVGLVRKYYVAPHARQNGIDADVLVCVALRLSMSPGIRVHPVSYQFQ